MSSSESSKTPSSNSIVRVPFHGDCLEAVQDGDDPWVSLKRACENVGLDTQAQQRRLERAPWSTTAVMAVVAEDSKTRDMLMVHIDCLPMWLATIDASRIKNDRVRAKLVSYQREAARVLRDHFFGTTVTARQFAEVLQEVQKLRAEYQKVIATLTLSQHPGMELLGHYGAVGLTQKITELRDVINANSRGTVHYKTVDNEVRTHVGYPSGLWQHATKQTGAQALSVVETRLRTERKRAKTVGGPKQVVFPFSKHSA